jgi:hypothetical protein
MMVLVSRGMFIIIYFVSWDHLVAPSRGFNGFLCPASLVMNCSGRRFPCLSSPPDGCCTEVCSYGIRACAFTESMKGVASADVLVASKSVA